MTARALKPTTNAEGDRRLTVVDVPAPTFAEPRPSLAVYAAFAQALDTESVVWDVGCSDGQGTALLVAEGRKVVGFDPSARASQCQYARCGATFATALPHAVTDDEAPDLIILTDVLGYVEQPEQLLLQLAQCAKESTRLWLWEPRSEPTQQLPRGKFRAFSEKELSELTALGGWQPHAAERVCSTFTGLCASPGPTAFIQTLAHLATGVPGPDTSSFEAAPELCAALEVQRARAALLAKSPDSASAHFLAALGHTPTNTLALCGLARLVMNGGELADAVHLLRTCLETDPTNVQGLELWVNELRAVAAQDAPTALQALANLHPAEANVSSALAQMHAESGELLLAIQDLERIRRYHPAPNLGLSLTLGWLLHSVGRHSDAEVEARMAALIDPDMSDVRDLLAALQG
jgi:tetratricopeptide (TPR) repeat protein